MKRLRLIPSFLFLCLLSFSACKDDDKADPTPTQPVTPAPTATLKASFTQDKEVIYQYGTNKTVAFTNTSTKAARYEWDFGNGQSSTIANPTAVFTTKGTYTVRLTAYDDLNNTSTFSKTVKVGTWTITKLKVNKISFTDTAGTAWDSIDGPDLYSSILSASASTVKTSTTNNVTAAMLPLELTYLTPVFIYDTDSRWGILGDDDGFPTGSGWSDYNPHLFSWAIEGPAIYAHVKDEIFKYKPSVSGTNNKFEVELICEFKTN